MVAAALGAAGLATSVFSSMNASDAAEGASAAQSAAAANGIAEQRRQFDSLQQLLSPYSSAGQQSLGAQQNLLGLNGNSAQNDAITGLQRSSQFSALAKQGEDAILQNASATGGLRGGNTQAALAQFRPQLLNQLINEQYAKLGGITSLGQNAAAMQGNAGMQTGANVANLLGQQGAAQAGGLIGQANANSGMANGALGALGMYTSLGGGFGGSGGVGGYQFNGGNVTGSDAFGYKGSGGF